MADPAAISDSHGEFVELANVGEDVVHPDSLILGVDGTRLLLSSVTLSRGSFLLLCRDSIRSSNGGMKCDRQLPGLSLANGKTITISVTQGERKEDFPIPPSRVGVSWENTMDKSLDYQRFLTSVGTWLQGDSATPGIRNSQSVEPARFDLGISGVTLGKDRVLAVAVKDFGQEMPGRSFLTARLDENWDGDFETPVDSMEVPAFSNGGKTVLFPLGREAHGLVQVKLSPDENPTNDVVRLSAEQERPLALSEWCPDPETGAPEWVEIRNATTDSGGQGRTLSLAQVVLNGQAFGSRAGELIPGSYLVVTESIEKFRAHYGNLKVHLLELPTWPGLRNTGDTLQLTAAGYFFDYATFTGEDLKGGGCLMPGVQGMQAGSGTPGFTEPSVEEFSWQVSGRIAGGGRTVDVEVKAPAGFRYVLRVFDLEGNQVRSLGGGGPGHHLHPWVGDDAVGELLKPGPYVICLSMEKHRTRRQAVVVVSGR